MKIIYNSDTLTPKLAIPKEEYIVPDATTTDSSQDSVLASVLNKLGAATAGFHRPGSIPIPYTVARSFGWDPDSISGLTLLSRNLQRRLIQDENISNRKIVVVGRWAWVEIYLEFNEFTQPAGAAGKEPEPPRSIETRYQPSHGTRIAT
jgi:hypothetical protein